MQWQKHKKAAEKIKSIFQRLDRYRIIHYSCQSFNRVENGQTAVITSIAVYSFVSDTTISFDIQSTAELLNINYENIKDNLKIIESRMLADFFKFISDDKNVVYLHWNMRDSQYGFQALSNRYKSLLHDIPKYEIPLSHQENIAKLLEDYYGMNYVDDPKMKNILKLNPKIRPKFFLDGLEEADAFDSGKYNDLHKSTLSKVRLFRNILNLVGDRRLNVSVSMIKSFGIHPQILFEMVKDTWWWALLIFFAGIILGKII